MNKQQYLIYRCLQTVFLIWLVVTFLWFFFRLLPGSFSDIMLQSGADPETVQAFREKWGLDDPLYVQYFQYIVNFVQLDMGTSVQHNEPVFEYVRMKIFNSIILVAPAITASYIFGSVYGLLLAVKRGSKFERYGVIPFIAISSVPRFFLGIVFIVLFAGGVFQLLPAGGMIGMGTYQQFDSWWRPYLTVSFFRHWILPFTVVAIGYTFLPLLTMRTSVMETLGQEFISYRRMRGIPKGERLKQVAKHSILPVLTIYPISMTRAIGGLVVIETVFNWPGMGFALLQAVLSRDYPVAQFVFALMAIIVIIANFGVDILYGWIDPRVSVSDGASE